MPRQPRTTYPGAVYHIIARGNNRKDIVYDDLDKMIWLTNFADVCEKYHWICYAYCLMDNHYHLLVETPEDTLSEGMHTMNTKYAQKINKRHDRSGHLFQGRFKSFLVEKDPYFFQLIHYILENPVRANMVSDPASYDWSSCQETYGLRSRGIIDKRFLQEMQTNRICG